MKHAIFVICVMILVFEFYVYMTKKQVPAPVPEATQSDPSKIPFPHIATGLVDEYAPYEPVIYRNVEGEKMFVKSGGVAESGKWYGIRVDEHGRVVCAPSSAINVTVEPDNPQPPYVYPWDMR